MLIQIFLVICYLGVAGLITKRNKLLQSIIMLIVFLYGSQIVLAIAVACPLALIARCFDFSFVGNIISRVELASRIISVLYLIAGALLFFIPYYVVMMLTKDTMMIEITNTVLGKLRKSK